MLVTTLIGLVAVTAAHANEPAPDRPMETAGGYLMSARSLELEVGGRWQQGFEVPARIKYGGGKIFEPRVAFDLSGVDQGQPDLVVEGKFGLSQKEGVGLALLAASAFPVAEGERWHGTVRALMTLPLKSLSLRANIGLDLVGDGQGIAFGGVPLLAALEIPFGSSMGGYLEAGTVANTGWNQALFDGGLFWRLTDILVLDTAVGWDLGAGSPFVHLGMTANLGRVGG